MTVTSRIFRRPAEAAGAGLCNNLWNVPKTKDCEIGRKNYEETKNGTHQQLSTNNTNGTAPWHKTTHSQNVAGHWLFSTPNQSENRSKTSDSPPKTREEKDYRKL